MANIVIFCNESNESIKNPGAGYTSKWNIDLAKAFEELGHRVTIISFLDENLLGSLKRVFNEKVDFAIAFNWVYANVLKLILTDGENILNKLNIPFVSWLWDGVCTPTNSALRVPGINHLIVACISEDEVDEIKMLSPHVQQVFFCPLGGSSTDCEGGGD